MWRLGALCVVVLVVVGFGFSLIDTAGGSDVNTTALMISPDGDLSGYARAIEPREWDFPADHGAHPDFQTEWWYYTGNVQTEDGRRFGYQFTIFRRAIFPQQTISDSEWRTDQVYMAHFTVSDIESQKFYHNQRFSRGSAGLAGATGEPYRVWLEDWTISSANPAATQQTIAAQGDEFAVNLALEQVKPPAMQGDNGLSPKSDIPGNASYYYSLSRLVTAGTITIGDEAFTVTGTSWMDHEFSTSALGQDAQGWDWFGLYFDNNTEMMLGQIRMNNGGKEPAFGGLLIYPDGTTRYLKAEDFTITATSTWASPHTGALYPAGWDVSVKANTDIHFTIVPLQADQELHSGDIQYWEGAVQITGDLTGLGYAELTGYVGTMQGRF